MPDPIPYTLIRSPGRRRTLSLTVLRDGEVVVRAPMRVALREVREFVERRAGWIERQRAARSAESARRAREAARPVASGDTVPYRGRQLRLLIEPSGGRQLARLPAVTLEEGALRVSVPGEERAGIAASRANAIRPYEGWPGREGVRDALVAWYRERALEHVEERVAAWVPLVGCAPVRVSVGDARSRWGSCSQKGALRFSWRLVMAEPDLLEYVVVHELVHLRIKNHRAKFWSEVERLLPDCKERRARLRAFGRSGGRWGTDGRR
jgi:predicted metal-dependent hydrolase